MIGHLFTDLPNIVAGLIDTVAVKARRFHPQERG
jgi:hypothetical protein